MADSSDYDSDKYWVPSGAVKVSSAALALARDFEAVASRHRGDWVVAFSWADSITAKRGPDEPSDEESRALTGIRRLLAIVVFASLQIVVNPSMSQTRCDPIIVASKYIAKRYPSFDPIGKKPLITELANHWRVTYELPPGMLGGVPIIMIDKQTCQVVRAEHTQ